RAVRCRCRSPPPPLTRTRAAGSGPRECRPADLPRSGLTDRAWHAEPLCMAVESATEARAQIIEEQFWAVVANIPGAVYRCACQDDWPIRFISDHIELLCGYPAADFIDNAVRTYGSIIHPHDRPGVAEEIDH